MAPQICVIVTMEELSAPEPLFEESPPNEKSSAFVETLRQGFASLAHNTPRAPIESSHVSNATAGLPSAASTKTPSWATAHNSILLQLIESDTVALSPYLDTLIHRELQSQIRNVPYTSSRSGASGVIDCLYLRTNITLAASFCSWAQTTSTKTTTDTATKSKLAITAAIKSAPSSANSISSTSVGPSVPVSAAAPSPCRNLHLKPYLNIYLTSCETLDQYKTKVRPALQLLEKTCNELNDPFLIIHVPRSKKPTLLASGMFSSSSLHSSGSAAIPELAACSGKEKEVYKRLQSDFSPQRVCMLSTLLQVASSTIHTNPEQSPTKNKKDEPTKEVVTSTTSPLFQQEWETVLQKLGNCIFTSFQDRMKLYQEEMKRLDALKISRRQQSQQKKALPTPPAENGNTSDKEGHSIAEEDKEDDDIEVNTEYMLVKEGMSFSYEQMRLYREALLHYEELSAWVPEQGLRRAAATSKRSTHDLKRTASSESLLIQENAERLVGPVDLDSIIECDATKRRKVWKYAYSGDTDGMRSMLEGTPDMAGGEEFSALVLHQYIFARISQLLFLLKRPVDIIRRSYDFVSQLYKMRRCCDLPTTSTVRMFNLNLLVTLLRFDETHCRS